MKGGTSLIVFVDSEVESTRPMTSGLTSLHSITAIHMSFVLAVRSSGAC